MDIRVNFSEVVDCRGETVAIDVSGWSAEGVTESTHKIAKAIGRAMVEAAQAVIENCCVGRDE